MTSSEVKERWLPVVGYEGLYDVSDQGRVWQRPGHLARAGRKATPGRILPITISRSHTQGVSLRADGVTTIHSVARLVAKAFIGPIPPRTLVLHRDDDPENNRVENLYWVVGNKKRKLKYKAAV